MATIDHFRTLCCLGLPQRPALIALAAAIREVIPAQWTRIGLIENEQPSLGFGEHPEFIPLFFQTFAGFDNDPNSFMRFFRPELKTGGVGASLPFQDGAYLESRYYNEFERRLDSCWLLEAILHDGRSSVASMVLSRPRAAKPFTDRDVRTLDSLRPWMLHALQARPSSPAGEGPAGEPGGNAASGTPFRQATAIFHASGKPLFQTSGTDHLYLILAGAIESYWRNVTSGRPEPPVQVLRVVRALVATATRGETPTQRPFERIHTSWGLLTIEAAWLAPVDADPATMANDIVDAPETLPIAVTINLYEHAAARAVRILRHSGASPAQVKVGVLLATGLSKPEIAERLGIAKTSVVDAARKLHRRLDTRNAAELGARLWLEEGDTTK